MSLFNKFFDAIKVNDDYYDDDEYFDEEDEEVVEDKPGKRYFKSLEDDLDDVEDEYEAVSEPVKKTVAKPSKISKAVKTKETKKSSKVTPLRNAKRNSSIHSSMEVLVVKPTSMEDTREIADSLLSNCTVFLNLEDLDLEISQRIIDFTSGACYAINGNLQKVSSHIFILTPEGVEINGDYQDMLTGSFDLPSFKAEY